MPSVFVLSLSQLSDESIVSIAALVLLLLSIAAVIWPKFAFLVRTIWTDFRAAFFEVLDFLDELQKRRRCRRSKLAHDLKEDFDSA